MFVIKYGKLYFHNKGRIILYESQQEANDFLNMFAHYSTNILSQEGIGEVMKVPMILNKCTITPIDFDADKVECGTISCKELFKDKEY